MDKLFLTVNYNNDPARELTTNTTMMYSKAITFTQILAFAFSFLRKIKDRIIAASATIKYIPARKSVASYRPWPNAVLGLFAAIPHSKPHADKKT